MEILNPKAQVLTNYEVLQALKSIKDKGKITHGLRNLATITYETIQYLENSPCKDQTQEDIMEFIRQIKKFNLTKTECLIMVNDPPTTALHIQLIIEDSEERLTDEQSDEILTLSARYLLKSTPEPT